MEVADWSGARTALVHHWLVSNRGGEHVFEAMADLFPAADLFTLVYEPSQVPPSLKARQIRSSFLQKLPRASRWYGYYLPLFSKATEQLDLAGYDLIISSDAATMKGVRANPRATHICYCHTPMRYIWSGYETYYRAAGRIPRLIFPAVRDHLRRWDFQAAQQVTRFVANSENVRKRIRDYYGRESVVIYPPVDTNLFVMPPNPHSAQEFFLLVSQLVPYKRADLVVEAFNQCRRPLFVVGEGPERRKLEQRAKSNVRFLGSQPRNAVVDAMQRCKGFVFAGEEDFGIVMAEAQSCGKPVVALARGGAAEIVQPGVTGILFEEESVDSLLDGLARFDRTQFNPHEIRASALRFNRQRFILQFSEFVRNTVSSPKCLAAV